MRQKKVLVSRASHETFFRIFLENICDGEGLMRQTKSLRLIMRISRDVFSTHERLMRQKPNNVT